MAAAALPPDAFDEARARARALRTAALADGFASLRRVFRALVHPCRALGTRMPALVRIDGRQSADPHVRRRA
jgi:hypothetical protein